MNKNITNAIVAAALIGVGCIAGHHMTCPPKNVTPQNSKVVVDLPSWKGKITTEIQNYLDTITDSMSSEFVPPEDRIATFDMDGTFLLEQPFAMDVLILEYHIHKNMSNDTLLNKKLDTFLSRVDSAKKMSEDDLSVFDIKYNEAMKRLNSLYLPKEEESNSNINTIKNYIERYRLEQSLEKRNLKKKENNKNKVDDKRKQIVDLNEIRLHEKKAQQYFNKNYLKN